MEIKYSWTFGERWLKVTFMGCAHIVFHIKVFSAFVYPWATDYTFGCTPIKSLFMHNPWPVTDPFKRLTYFHPC